MWSHHQISFVPRRKRIRHIFPRKILPTRSGYSGKSIHQDSTRHRRGLQRSIEVVHSVPKAPPLKRTLQKRKYHGAIRTHVWRALIDNLLLKSRSIKMTRADLPRETRSTVRGARRGGHPPPDPPAGKRSTVRGARRGGHPDPPAGKQCLRDLPHLPLIALPRIIVRIGRGNVSVGRGACPLKRKRLGRN